MQVKKKKYRVIDSDTLCSKCNVLAECRTHIEILERHMNQPFYFDKWYMCMNPKCKTTMFSFDEDKVFTPKGQRNLAYSQEREAMINHLKEISLFD